MFGDGRSPVESTSQQSCSAHCSSLALVLVRIEQMCSSINFAAVSSAKATSLQSSRLMSHSICRALAKVLSDILSLIMILSYSAIGTVRVERSFSERRTRLPGMLLCSRHHAFRRYVLAQNNGLRESRIRA